MMLPAFYNHNYQILQTSDYVAIVVEMIHDARIIPLDGRSHLSPIDAAVAGRLPRSLGRGHLGHRHHELHREGLRERRRRHRLSEETHIMWSSASPASTLTRSTTGSRLPIRRCGQRPWTAAAPMSAMDETLFEYACHEGNRSVPLILSGNRAQEALEAR